MLNGSTYETPEFYCTKVDGKLYKFASKRCAMSWKQPVRKSGVVQKPERSLGFRSGTLLQDFRSGSLWYIDGAVRRPIDFDAWQKHGFSWTEVVVCSRRELELHEAKGELE